VPNSIVEIHATDTGNSNRLTPTYNHNNSLKTYPRVPPQTTNTGIPSDLFMQPQQLTHDIPKSISKTRTGHEHGDFSRVRILPLGVFFEYFGCAVCVCVCERERERACLVERDSARARKEKG